MSKIYYSIQAFVLIFELFFGNTKFKKLKYILKIFHLIFIKYDHSLIKI